VTITFPLLLAGTTIQPIGGGSTGRGGAGTYNLNQAVNTGTLTGVTATSTILNVTRMQTGTIDFSGAWTVAWNSAATQTTAVQRTIQSAAGINPGSGGVGTYQLSGAGLTLTGQFQLFGAGAPGVSGTTLTLTLHGITTGTFVVGTTVMVDGIIYTLRKKTASNPDQWVVTGSGRFAGPQVINGSVWEVIG